MHAFLCTCDHSNGRSSVAKIGTRALPCERFDGFSAYVPLDAQATRFFEDDSVEILIREVLKAEGIVEAKTAREPGVDLAEHLLHLLLVPDEDHRNVLSRRAVD